MRRKSARKLVHHIAALRRHARMLSGNEEEAAIDRLVRGLRAKDYRALPVREVRTRLFRDFHDAWATQRDAANVDSVAQGAARDRYALLLRHIEGFSVQDVAAILRSDAFELQDRLENAYSELHGKRGCDVLLVEDDPVLAKSLTDMIESLGHRVLGVARDCAEAVATARSVPLDAVVADIHSAVERPADRPAMAAQLGEIDAPIVLVAPDTPVQLNVVDSAYVVSTPFQPPELKVLLSQALHNRQYAIMAPAARAAAR